MVTKAENTLQVLEASASRIDAMHVRVDVIPNERREVLDSAAEFVATKLTAGEIAELTFICTHNSRRSHLSQIWAQVAADYYGLDRVKTYSGGTEATACNIRTVRALRRSGLEVVATTAGDNPKYLVQYAENRPAMEVYSKVYDSQANPQDGYAAMMCCGDVDERCPVVHGAEIRVPLHYKDPKAADDTPNEAATYDERSAEIGGEMFYLFWKVDKLLNAS